MEDQARNRKVLNLRRLHVPFDSPYQDLLVQLKNNGDKFRDSWDPFLPGTGKGIKAGPYLSSFSITDFLIKDGW